MSVDYEGLESLVDFMIGGGINGLISCAFVAEVESLDLDEHRQVLKTVIRASGGRVPVYSGVGRSSLLETRELISFAESAGSDGLFVPTPYCNSYSMAEAVAYFKDVASRASIPLMIYNCPTYSGLNLSPELQAKLAETTNVTAAKEGNQSQLHKTVLAGGDNLAVLSARDSHLVESLAVGASGVTSFVANVAPGLVVELYRALVTDDDTLARSLHERLVPLVAALTSRSFPMLVKHAMSLKGLPSGPARRIESPVGEVEVAELERALQFADASVPAVASLVSRGAPL